jgi:hypothetical protein
MTECRAPKCEETARDDSDFCKRHKHMEDYTDKMMKSIKFCKRCKKDKYIEKDYVRCAHCRETGNALVEKKRKEKGYCKLPGCHYVSKGDGNKFCEIHQEFDKYSDTELKRVDKCSGCKSLKYIAEGEIRCDGCIDLGKKKNEKMKDKRAEQPKCKWCNKFKAKDNGYCGKHQTQAWRISVEKKGKKVCSKYTHGCRIELDKNYGPKKCPKHLKEERIADKKNRDKKKTLAEEHESDTTKICIECGLEKDNSEFIGFLNKDTERCSTCREGDHRADAKRAGQHRNCYKNEKIINVYNDYKKKAKDKSIPFKLLFVEFVMLVTDICHYCGKMSFRDISSITKDTVIPDLIGIDRKDSSKGYIFENCLPCCAMCNYMKGSLPHDTFLNMCNHIMINLKYVEGELKQSTVPNRISMSYKRYKHNAKKKRKLFNISEVEYINITKHNCYLCGKKNTNVHKNGIDRIDSNIGYIFDNCRSCCSICNYIKNKYDLTQLLIRMLLIVKHHFTKKNLHCVNAKCNHDFCKKHKDEVIIPDLYSYKKSKTHISQFGGVLNRLKTPYVNNGVIISNKGKTATI